jgi:hypothetical protein
MVKELLLLLAVGVGSTAAFAESAKSSMPLKCCSCCLLHWHLQACSELLGLLCFNAVLHSCCVQACAVVFVACNPARTKDSQTSFI